MIGAGSLVTAGMVVPPRSLIYGSPAKVVRPATAEEIRIGIEGARDLLPRHGEEADYDRDCTEPCKRPSGSENKSAGLASGAKPPNERTQTSADTSDDTTNETARAVRPPCTWLSAGSPRGSG